MGPGIHNEGVIGRAGTVLVFGQGKSAVAMITAMIAGWSPSAPHKLSFRGPVEFDSSTKRHIRSTVFQVVEEVCQGLGLETGGYTVSGVNLSAASSHDIGLEITGYSADLPVFLAMLSARLGLQVPQDIVSTGHIASRQGDIRMVHNIPAKIHAAMAEPGIHRIVFPAPDADQSLATMAQQEQARIQSALNAAADELVTMRVNDVAELLPLFFTEHAIVLAALANHGIDDVKPRAASAAPVERIIQILGGSIRERFFQVLETALSEGNSDLAHTLLEHWAGYHAQKNEYPTGFGNQLLGIVRSLPPMVRTRKLVWPLISIQSCIALSQCATQTDFNDVLDLYQAAGGAKPEARLRGMNNEQPAGGSGKTNPSTLTIVIAEIEQENLARKIGIPIDSARARFTLDSVIAETQTEALDTINAFYCHLLRYIGRATDKLAPEHVGPDAYALLERTYANEGGAKAAIVEARTGTKGGLRYVLDRMTEQFKRQRQEEYVLQVVATAIDPTDLESRNAFIREFFARFPDAVPQECLSEPVERFSSSYELIIRAHVNSMEQVKHVLRGL